MVAGRCCRRQTDKQFAVNEKTFCYLHSISRIHQVRYQHYSTNYYSLSIICYFHKSLHSTMDFLVNI